MNDIQSTIGMSTTLKRFTNAVALTKRNKYPDSSDTLNSIESVTSHFIVIEDPLLLLKVKNLIKRLISITRQFEKDINH